MQQPVLRVPMALSFLPESVLADWIQPGAVVAAAVGGLGLLVSAFRHLETKLEKRIDEVKIEVKASETRQMAALNDLKTEFQASEERQMAALNDLKTEVKADAKASEERQMAAINDLKMEVKADAKASEERQRGDLQLLRSDVKSLGDKMDSLLLLLAKGAVAPTAGHGS